MKYLWIGVSIILYLLMIIMSYLYLPTELKHDQRLSYLIYQDELYYDRLGFIWVSESDQLITRGELNGQYLFTFSFSDIVVIVENQEKSILLDDTLIGLCNVYNECVDLNVADSYGVDDLTDYAYATKIHMPTYPGIVNEINIRMFLLLMTLVYMLMSVLFYYGVFGHDRIEDFLRFTTKGFDRTTWLNDEHNEKWRVLAVRITSLGIASFLFIYLILVFVAIIQM